MINSGKEWAWMDNNQKLKKSMELEERRDEMKWVEKVLTHKDNKGIHYPALKQLINLYHNKWANKTKEPGLVDIYRQYLKSILRSEFGR
tara:strand:- start:83 stop:349 length:267 start_codon:yes stop_codon:yes gene_type:complete